MWVLDGPHICRATGRIVKQILLERGAVGTLWRRTARCSAVVRQSRLPTLSKHRRSNDFSEESKGRSSVPATYSEPSKAKKNLVTSVLGMEHGCHTEFAARQSLPQVGLHDPISRGRTEVFLLMTQFLQEKKLRTLCVAGSNRSRSI